MSIILYIMPLTEIESYPNYLLSYQQCIEYFEYIFIVIQVIESK